MIIPDKPANNDKPAIPDKLAIAALSRFEKKLCSSEDKTKKAKI